MTTALALPGNLDLAELRDPQASAEMVYYLGAINLPNNGIPQRKIKVDETTGELEYIEPDRKYIRRIWTELDEDEDGRDKKGLIVRTGLQLASFYREGLSDGIQLVVYRARRHGWWVTTDQVGGGDEKAFREWVKDAITAEDASPTEATQLASTVLNLEFLAANGYEGLPVHEETGEVDLEQIFADRRLYNRWRRVASRLRNLVELAHEKPNAKDVQESIQEIVDTVTDEDKDFDALDKAGRIKPTLPPVVIEISGRDGLGRHLFAGAATDAQLARLRSKLDGAADWRLKGERYGVTDHALAEYRTETNADGVWRREYDEKAGWSAFEEVDEIPDGYPEGVAFEDPDWGTRYVRQWERKES